MAYSRRRARSRKRARRKMMSRYQPLRQRLGRRF